MPQLDQLMKMLAAGKKPAPRPAPTSFSGSFLGDDTVDPSVRNDLFSNSMQDELQGRMRGVRDPAELGDLSRMLGVEKAGLDSGPLAKQQTEVAAQRAGDLGAINEGFTGDQAIEQQPGGKFTATSPMSPMQQREIYRRGQTEANSPATLQGARIANSEFEQSRSLNANNRTITAQMAPSMLDAETRAKYNDALLNGKLDSSGFKGMGRYGPQFTPERTVPVNPNALMADYRKQLGFQQGGGDPLEGFGLPNTPDPARDQSVRDIVMNAGLHSTSAQSLLTILSDPERRHEPFESLFDADPSDADLPKMRQLLLQLRGF